MESSDNNLTKPRSLQIIDIWLPKKDVQDFFNYGNTKMSTFGEDNNVRTSKVGKRIFYNRSDIIKLINDNIISDDGNI